MRISKYVFLMMLILLLLSGVMLPLGMAQGNIVLKITVPEWMSDVFDDELFDPFEAEHPGVSVVIEPAGDNTFYGSPAYGFEESMEASLNYATSADVLYMTSYSMSVEATRAGHFLDLAPLVSGDPTLNVNDFFPAVWQSVQWDNGVWMLPVSVDVQLLIYDKKAFDDAGLAYPDGSWTLDDLANAARTLTEYNAENEVTRPGMINVYDPSALFASLLGHGFVDTSVVPNVPMLATPELEALLTEWRTIEEEGITGYNFQGDMNYAPLLYEGPWRIWQGGFMPTDDTEEEPEWAGALLPGGRAALNLQGFAVSGGTQYRDEAYALTSYLTNNPEIATRFFGSSPARQSLVGVETEDTAFFPEIPEDVRALINDALTNALPLSEMRFAEYLNVALNKIRDTENPIDIPTALQEAETDALDNLTAAAEQRDTTAVFVATAVPTPVLAAGEVSLDFALTSFMSPMPNRDELETLIDEFVASDPEVGQIVLDTSFRQINEFTENYDCFYLPYNAVPGLDTTTVLNLDPFFAADPTYDPNDIVGNTMAQLQRENLTWAYPIVIQPQILWYHSTEFADAGAIEPSNGWTIADFNDALQSLHIDPDDPAPFNPQAFGSTHLLLLIAAYGGVPMDYNTIPVTINFTDPANLDAIRQVLDLAKDGYIEYTELANFGGGGGGFAGDIPITTDSLNAASWRFNQLTDPEAETSDDSLDPYRLTTYPVGSQYTPISYDIGTAYISANAENPEACYRWLTTLAQHPEIVNAMPARRSLINSGEIVMTQGQDLVDFYLQIDALMEQPNALIFPSQFSGGGDNTPNSFIVQYWMNRAFDRYVLEDADLEVELADAEANARDYLECAASIPAFDPALLETQEQQIDYFRQFGDCATAIDPSLEPLFNFGEEEE
jgi:ABC-type glycerol-3-phosphate transport system substrate-binding protein